MLFDFIRYTQPAWQYNITPVVPGAFASCYCTGPCNMTEDFDDRFETESAKKAELGYRLWNKGVLLMSTPDDIEQLNKLPKPTLKDEYTFVRKYWGVQWAVFALLLRVGTGKNMFKEWHAFIKTNSVKRINAFEAPRQYEAYDTFQSPLVISQPLVTVIIPTLNRYQYLADVLADLEKQTYQHFEVIVIDQSDDFNPAFYDQFKLSLTVIQQREKLLWTARNRAVAITEADYLLFFDDDSRVEPDWIVEHLKCIDFFGADISAGVSLARQGQKIPVNYSYFRWADQFDSGNAMVKRSVMQKIGMFDEMFNGQRMGDGEFGFRAYKNGIKSISNYKAARVHLKVGTGGLREMGHWDAFRTRKWFAPKPVPSVIYLYKKYLPPAFSKNALLLGIMLSNIAYKDKSHKGMLLLSIFITILKAPLLYIQYYKSKRIASIMLATK